jgi:hypothetical protein
VTALTATFLPAIIKKCTRYYIQVLTILAGPKTIDVQTLQCQLHSLHQTISPLSRMNDSFNHSTTTNIASPLSSPIFKSKYTTNKLFAKYQSDPNVNIKRNLIFQHVFRFSVFPPPKPKPMYVRTLCTYCKYTVFRTLIL